MSLIVLATTVYQLSKREYADFTAAYLLARGCVGNIGAGNLQCSDPFTDLLRAQIWRIFTPALVHGNIGHLMNNLSGVLWFGSAVECVDGKRTFLWLVLGLQAVTAVIEVCLVLGGSDIVAAGMSGVVYGLGGYVLARRWSDKEFAARTWRVLGLYALMTAVSGVTLDASTFEVGAMHAGALVVGTVWGLVWAPHTAGPGRER